MVDLSSSTAGRQGSCRCNLDEENLILQARILELEEKLAEKDAELQRRNGVMGAMTGQLEEQIHERTKQLEKSNTRLELANTGIKQQAANMLKNFACMSHEIRTPLNCIVGMGSLLMDTPLNQFQQESVRMITTSGDLLSTVVDDVLDYSKLESGDFNLNITNVDLQMTMDSVATSIQMKADETGRGLWVRSYIGTTVPQFFDTDGKRLQQVLYNLLGNAVKFSKDNGYIDLKCNIINNQQGKRILFQVKDYGTGIAEANFAKIFLPFHQENKDTGAVYGGTGLGLSITAKLIQTMGGKISVQSSIGNWTEFTADFPYEAPEATFIEHIPRLANTAVIVVVARPTTDCPVIGWLRQIGVTVKLIPSCNDLEATAKEVEAQDDVKHYIPLVHDEGFLPEVYDRFASNRMCQLMTFGYKNNVYCAAAHVHSPCRVFPSLFLPILGDLVERSKTNNVVRIESTLDSSILIIRNQDLPAKVVPVLARKSSHGHAYSDIRVLIAEDNRVNQRVLTKTLNRLGLEQIDIVDNGQKAVEAASKKVYDVIFMDMEMPVMNGLDACREITKNKLRLLPIVVFVTAHAMESFRNKADNAGGYGFISKPFNLQKIDDMLAAIPWDKLTETEYRTQTVNRQPIVSLSMRGRH